MKSPIVVIGIGEMGSVFARGFLRTGHPVYPVTRDTDLAAVAKLLPSPELVLVAVAENTLHTILEQMPAAWHSRLALLQNELLPGDWRQYGYTNPTVISVWFEKKKGQDVKVLIPSPVHGPCAEQLKASLGSLDIPARLLADEDALLFELVVKNVYIITTNCAGLATGGTVSELWANHRELAEAVAHEVIQLQESLTGQHFAPEKLIAGMLEAFEGDPDHRCMGRSAPARLARALQQADASGLAIPRLREIATHQQ
jgi:ketopantoate reductase